jgi:hypothetical protein
MKAQENKGPNTDEFRALRRAIQRDEDYLADAVTDQEDEDSTARSNLREQRRVARFVTSDDRFLHSAYATQIAPAEYRTQWYHFTMDQKLRAERLSARDDQDISSGIERIVTLHRELRDTSSQRTNYRLRQQLHRDIMSLLRTLLRIRCGDTIRAIAAFDEEVAKELRKQRKSEMSIADIRTIYDATSAKFPRSLFPSPNRGRGRLGNRGRGWGPRGRSNSDPQQQQSQQPATAAPQQQQAPRGRAQQS